MPKRKHGPKTLTQYRRMKENDYKQKPWLKPVFSYGINLNIDEVSLRLPGFKGFDIATLSGWQMTWDKTYGRGDSTFCNVHQKRGAEVFGVILYVGEKELKALDRFEGYPEHYQREMVVVKQRTDYGSIERKAWVYTSKHRDPDGAPSWRYCTGVMEGLHALDAPASYIESVRADAARRFEKQGILAPPCVAHQRRPHPLGINAVLAEARDQDRIFKQSEPEWC